MMTRTHTVVLAFALVFAMGMALAVAILCIPRAADEPPDTTPVETAPHVPDTLTEVSDETLPLPPDTSNGLQFLSSGDGTCRLVGIGSCTDGCVVIPEYSPAGERVIEIAPRAFYGVPTVTAVQIPASVRTIGELAFSACENLTYISVSASSPYFCDLSGVLYTADRTTLLLYPPMRAGTKAEIGIPTVKICDMAFYGCIYLNSVEYAGTAEEWEQIVIGSKNYSLIAAAKVFLGG